MAPLYHETSGHRQTLCCWRKSQPPHQQPFASNHFVLKLDVRQLVFQLGWGGSSDHLACWCKSQFKYQVIVKSVWIKNAVICQDLMVKIYAIVAAINLVQFVFGIDARCFFVARI